MASTVGRVNACNQGIFRVGGLSIISPTDESVEARVCNEHWETQLKKVLADGDWSFATKFAQLTTPVYPDPIPDRRGFILPDDHIRIIKVRNNGDFKYTSDTHEVVGNEVLVNADSTYIKYVFYNTDFNSYSPGFIAALGLAMASVLAIPVASSNTLKTAIMEEYDDVLSDARANDGKQSTNERIRSSWIINARRRYG